MSRYINEIRFNGNQNETFIKIHTLLLSKGFEYITYDGENVFKKGNGTFVAPTFVKVSFLDGTARVEAWIKLALLPGVYIGEYGMTGFVGMGGKGAMKKAVSQIEQILFMSNNISDAKINETQAEIQGIPCKKCGTILKAENKFCINCGSPVIEENQVTLNKVSSLREFIENVAPLSIKKSIRSAAIWSYVCAGITFVVALAVEPFGIIDAAILLGLALGMHLRKSRAFAIGLLVFACFELLASLVASATLGGIVELIVSIYAVVIFNRANKMFIEHIKQ